jgi:large subunit ribosomal protein L17
MRHRVRAGVLGRSSSHRLAMYRNLVTSLLEYERIETTDAKAKGVRRLAERMITLGKRGDLHARRRALRVIRSRKVTAKVFDDLAERFRDRPGGYTRIVKVRNRMGDAAPMSIIELVEGVVTADAKSAKAKKAGGTAKAAPKKAAEKTEPAKKRAASKKKAPAKKAEEPKKKTESKKKTSKKKTAKKTTSKKKTTKKTASKKTASKKK